jgi:HTH-type transcriptional regulator / antitoxin HipB
MEFTILTSQQLTTHLRSLRKARKMTQAQLAQRLGLGQSRVGKIERHPELVSVEQLIVTLGALGARLVISVPDRSNSARQNTDAIW